MSKILLVMGIFFSLLKLSCESTVPPQKQDSAGIKASPTDSVKKEALNQDSSKSQADDYLNQALKYKVAGEYDKAIEALKRSIEAGNNDKEMYRRVAELYFVLKKYKDAEIYLRKVLEKDSEDVSAHWKLAGVLVWQLEEYNEGLKEALISREKDKSNTSYVMDRTIGKAYDGLGDYKNAVKYYKSFLRRSSFIPNSDDYKITEKRVLELENLKS